MPRNCPPEFPRKAIDLAASGRKVVEAARLLGTSDQMNCVWRHQHLIDTGTLPGTTSSGLSELAAARKHIAKLETELAMHRRLPDCRAKQRPPKAVRSHPRVMTREHLPVQPVCRVPHAESGYLRPWDRPPSNRLVKHAWLTQAICDIHTTSRGTYGSRQGHAELGPGLRIHVSHSTVELLM
jgi:transposase-like protein